MKQVIDKLKELNAKRIFIQFPEGLKLKIQEIANSLEREGFETVLCLEPTYGACDIRDDEANRLNCDAILHIGHSDLKVKSKLPVIYWGYFIDTDVISVLEKNFGELKKFEKIGLVTNLQFVKYLEEVKTYLRDKGKKVFTFKALEHEGQILGCELTAAKKIEDEVDCFLCISAGKFYPLGLALRTKKSVLNLDLERGKIYSIDELKYQTQKIIEWNKAQLKDAKKVGILISWKGGQMLCNPFELKEKLIEMGKEIYLLALDEITPEKLEGLKVDFLINCACPRIGIDDLRKFKTPLLNWNEI
jgi:2-(3-amino-3-carboxypropyl)histidine synthase